MKTKSLLIIALAFLMACSKSNKITVNSSNLTNCQSGSTCTYNYTDNATFTTNSLPVNGGGNRVFVYKTVNADLCGATTSFYFKTLLNSDAFDISSNEIAAGQSLNYYFSCACCDVLAGIHPIDGDIKGQKINTNTWLINASVVLAGFNDIAIDTLKVNQYFTQSSLN